MLASCVDFKSQGHTWVGSPKVLLALDSAVVSSKSLISLSSASSAAFDGTAPLSITSADEVVWISET